MPAPRILPIDDKAVAEPQQTDGVRKSCASGPLRQVEGIAIARAATLTTGEVVEADMFGGNVAALYVLKQFGGLTTAVRPKKASELMLYFLGGDDEKFTTPGIVPGGPSFAWIIRDVSEPARKAFNNRINIELKAGQVYVWSTNGKKMFPKDAASGLRYLCDFDQNASDDDLKSLFLKKLTSQKQPRKSR